MLLSPMYRFHFLPRKGEFNSAAVACSFHELYWSFALEEFPTSSGRNVVAISTTLIGLSISIIFRLLNLVSVLMTIVGLKIKFRPGAAKASKGSQPEDSGEDVGADSGDDSGLNDESLKRKRESPPASNIPNKRPAREESPVPLGANGEPLEVVPGKSERVAGDLHVVKQRVGQLHSSVGAILQAEQAVLVGFDRDYEEVKKVTPSLENLSHGQLLVNSITTTDQHGAFIPGRRAGADPAGFGEHSHSMSTGMQASVPSGTPGSRTTDGTAEQHTIPSHAGKMFSTLFNDALLNSMSRGVDTHSLELMRQVFQVHRLNIREMSHLRANAYDCG